MNIPMQEVVYCQDCDAINTSKGHRCEVCGGCAIVKITGIRCGDSQQILSNTVQHAKDAEFSERYGG